MTTFSAPTPLLARWLGDWTLEVDRNTLRADLVAGLLGALLVLPQAIAFAALAGLPPAMGLAAAVLPCAVAALAGSSRHVLSGPTNATALALGAMLVPLAAGDASLIVPLALALTEGSEQRAPMGQAVIGGVITSSLLTLVVVPVVYCWLDDLGLWFKRRVFGIRPAPAALQVAGQPNADLPK